MSWRRACGDGARVRGVRAAYLVALVLFAWSFAAFYVPGKGFTYLIAFGGKQAEERIEALRDVDYYVAQNSDGYDAQYYAQIAVRPSLRDPDLKQAVDSLPYRGRRILMPWTAYVLGLGQPAWILQAFAVFNALCWFALAAVLLRWFPPINVSNLLRWLGVLFSFGLCLSVRYALIDGPSLLLIALAVWCVEKRRPWLATGLLALAGLGKETNLLGGIALAPAEARPWRRWLVAGTRAVLVALPLVLWLVYIQRVVGPATDLGARNFAGPFSGYVAKWATVLAAFFGSARNIGTWWSLLTLVTLTTQFLFFVLRPRWRDAWWRVALTFAVLMIFLGDAVWEGYPGAASRVLLPMQLAFNVLVPRGRKWLVVLVLGNLTLVCAPAAFAPPPGPGYTVEGPAALRQSGGRTMSVRFVSGWYGVEAANGQTWCWSDGGAVLEIFNPAAQPVRAHLRFGMSTIAPRRVTLIHAAAQLWQGEVTDRSIHAEEAATTLAPGWNRLEFQTDAPPQTIAGDPRLLGFCVRDLVVTLSAVARE